MEYPMDRYEDIIKRVHYKDWEIKIQPSHDGASYYYLQVCFIVGGETHSGRKWLLSQHMTESEIVQTALLAVLTAEEHEAREKFTYLDEPVFGPHLNVDRLFDITQKTDGFVYREVNRPNIPVMEQPHYDVNV